MVTIQEIIGRSDQGRTEPFICRGSDGEVYFVKGRFAGRESQIKEYICGCLAVKLDLPIAPFEIVEVPIELIQFGGRGDLNDLGSGPAFGSRKCGPVTEITYAQLGDVDPVVAKGVVVFDWWIKNGDRLLTAAGGNPNLLWDQALDRMVMIDHNLAFDEDFEVESFRTAHAFHTYIPQIFEDFAERARYGTILENAFSILKPSCDSIPDQWIEEAPEWFDIQEIEQLLSQCTTDGFWEMQP